MESKKKKKKEKKKKPHTLRQQSTFRSTPCWWGMGSYHAKVIVMSIVMSHRVRTLNLSTKKVIILLSKSSPPRKVSPFVDCTSSTPCCISRIETSKVPPPRSYTAISLSSSICSTPYANAAAVGSLMIRSTFKPAIAPASRVA